MKSKLFEARKLKCSVNSWRRCKNEPHNNCKFIFCISCCREFGAVCLPS